MYQMASTGPSNRIHLRSGVSDLMQDRIITHRMPSCHSCCDKKEKGRGKREEERGKWDVEGSRKEKERRKEKEGRRGKEGGRNSTVCMWK